MITGEMIAHLKKQYAEAGAEEERLRSMSGSRLTEYIIEQYHQPEREMLASIDDAWQQVPPRKQRKEQYHHVYALFVELRSMLTEHFAIEEAEVFPLTAGTDSGRVELLTAQMELEHGEAERKIEEMNQEAEYFLPDQKDPEEIQAFYRKMAELFAHIKKHVDCENNLLFPKMQQELK